MLADCPDAGKRGRGYKALILFVYARWSAAEKSTYGCSQGKPWVPGFDSGLQFQVCTWGSGRKYVHVLKKRH